jgi:hypothetical protein
MKQWLLILLGCVAFGSCSDKDNDDREAPVITLTSPSNNQVFSPGEIKIQGTITDNAYIGQVHVEVYNNDTGAEIAHVHIHPATKMYALDYPIVLQPGIDYKIKVVADDPAANTSSKQVEISCN